jgi:hypothetical protein
MKKNKVVGASVDHNPMDVIAPVINVAQEILRAGYCPEARLICFEIFLSNLDHVDVPDMAKRCNLRYPQILIGCRELRASGFLKTLSTDMYSVVRPIGLKDLGFVQEESAPEVSDGES